jgi:hypothetical protein
MCLQPFYDKGPHWLLWGSSRAARGIITISGITNRLNCEILIVYTEFTNMPAGRGLETLILHFMKLTHMWRPRKHTGLQILYDICSSLLGVE